jgi:hypothetical protein
MSHKRTDVEISKQILRIGSAAYPVQNIARARTVKLAPNRGAALRRYLKAVVLWVLLGIGAAVANAHSLPAVAGGLTLLIVLLVIISTIKLIRVLYRKTYYALVIETAGPPDTVLVSPGENELHRIVDEIMDAINNPAATFHTSVENHNYDMRGARGFQVGGHNTQHNTFSAE